MIFLCIFSLILVSVQSTAKCSTLTCPTGYFSNATLSDETCAADPCTTDADRDTCCYSNAKCTDYQTSIGCPTGQDHIDGATCPTYFLDSCTNDMCCATGCDARVCGEGERKMDKTTCADADNCLHWECCSECESSEINSLSTMQQFSTVVSTDVSNCYELIREVGGQWCDNTLKEIGTQRFSIASDDFNLNNVTNVDYTVYRHCPMACKSCDKHHEDFSVELTVTLVLFCSIMAGIVLFFVFAPKPDNSVIDEKNKELNKPATTRADPYEPIARDEYGEKYDRSRGKIGVEVEAGARY